MLIFFQVFHKRVTFIIYGECICLHIAIQNKNYSIDSIWLKSFIKFQHEALAAHVAKHAASGMRTVVRHVTIDRGPAAVPPIAHVITFQRPIYLHDTEVQISACDALFLHGE